MCGWRHEDQDLFALPTSALSPSHLRSLPRTWTQSVGTKNRSFALQGRVHDPGRRRGGTEVRGMRLEVRKPRSPSPLLVPSRSHALLGERRRTKDGFSFFSSCQTLDPKPQTRSSPSTNHYSLFTNHYSPATKYTALLSGCRAAI